MKQLMTGFLVLLTLYLAVDTAYAQRSGDLRLVSSSSTTGRGGRLEIFLFGEWGTVCDDGFGTTEGSVACRQLGYSSVISVGSVGRLGYSQASFSTRTWLDNVDCSSFHTDLLSCRHNGIGVEDCNHSEDIALVCSGSSSGGSSSSSSSSDDIREGARIYVGIFWGSLTVTILLPIGILASIICFISGASMVVAETQGQRNITREATGPTPVVVTEVDGKQYVTELSKLSPQQQAPSPGGPANPPFPPFPPGPGKPQPPAAQRPPTNQKALPLAGQKAPPPASQKSTGQRVPAGQQAPPQRAPPLAGQKALPQQAPPPAGQPQRAPPPAGQKAQPPAGQPQRAPPPAGQKAPPPHAAQRAPPPAGQKAHAAQRAPPPAGPQPPPRSGQQTGQQPIPPQRKKPTRPKPPGESVPPKPKSRPTMI